MATFRYEARDSVGKKIEGALEAPSRDGVASQLLANGAIPITITEMAAAADNPLQKKLDELLAPKIELDDLMMFSRQMASLMKAGVVVNKAARGLAQSTRNPTLQKVLFDIERTLNTGQTLTNSLSRHREVFSDLYISMVSVGENTGRIDLVFAQMSSYLGREKETRRSITGALRYPMFVFIAIGAAMVILNIFVIPVFADMFRKFSADLPWPTKVLIATSDFFVHYWYAVAVVLIAAVFSWRRFIATEKGELFWAQKKLGIPIVGSVLERALLSRFARTFALMTRAGVPLIQALELCARAVDNAFLAVKVRQMRQGVERGESLLRIATLSGMFTPLVLQMIAVGEDTGQVDDLLDEVADFYDAEVEFELKTMAARIEPLLIVAMTGLVAMLAMGIFLPLWDMMSVMQGK
jgi:MSHA biogenesis protein MshG